MQQRYYDPVIGRFYSNDPVGFSADNPMLFNRYAYANNNPYKFVDPDGRASIALEATKQVVTTGVAASPLAVAAGVATAALMPTKMGDGTMYNEDGSDVPVAEPSDNNQNDGASNNSDGNGGHRTQDTPSKGEPNSTVEGKHRTREYGSDGKPSRDYDKPHQGHQKPHVHEWTNGKREHPGREYSPIPRDEKKD